MRVSYIISGEEQLDIAEAVCKIDEIFHTKEIIFRGGGTLNWSMLHDDQCDEVNIIMMSVADREKYTHSLFEADDNYSTPLSIGFPLTSVEPLQDGSVWMCYGVNGPVDAATP